MKALHEEAVERGEPSPLKDSQLFVKLAEQLMPVTVNISTSKTIKGRERPFTFPFGENDPFKDFFGDEFYKRFFGGQVPSRDYKMRSLGSGFIIDKEGYIITNNHVIEGADEIKVRLSEKTSDKEEYDAKIIGRDPKTDVALIKIAPHKGLPVATLGDSDKLRVGEWVMAIGNPFGLDQTVTVGIVSAKWRKIGMGPYENFIQTDAAINQGNSGGPLFDTRGEVVGVNSAIFSPSGGNIGIGFAIPINLAKNVIEQLKEKGRVVRGWLGVVVQMVTPELAESFGLTQGKGALVADVEGGGPADKGGIRRGDVITTFDRREIKEMNDLPLMVAQTPVGKEVEVTIVRDGKKMNKEVTIGELKEEKTYAAAEGETGKDVGMEVSELTSELARRYGVVDTKGVLVTGVEDGSSADAAGIKEGDVIVEVNREPVENLDAYNKAVKKALKEDKVHLLIKRAGTSLFVVITLGK
ncbi:MAG: hypothetical protein AMS17_10790 [Spirochaetes bacterium DG_61]|nr:MAG: hypothetical protein AMS17_10790 [Spirochaetes bacterium DG_61]